MKNKVGQADYNDFVYDSGILQNKQEYIKKDGCSNEKPLSLSCNFGKILKYLLRMELTIYKKQKKKNKNLKYDSKIIICNNNKCYIKKNDYADLFIKIINNLTEINKSISKINKDDINKEDIHTILSGIAKENNIQIPTTIQDGKGLKTKYLLHGGDGGGCGVFFLLFFIFIIAGIGTFGALAGVAAIFLLLAILCAAAASQNGGALGNIKINKIIIMEKLKIITDIFKDIKDEVNGIGEEYLTKINNSNNVDIHNICFKTDDCLNKKDKEFLKEVLKSMESIFKNIELNESSA